MQFSCSGFNTLPLEGRLVLRRFLWRTCVKNECQLWNRSFIESSAGFHLYDSYFTILSRKCGCYFNEWSVISESWIFFDNDYVINPDILLWGLPLLHALQLLQILAWQSLPKVLNEIWKSVHRQKKKFFTVSRSRNALNDLPIRKCPGIRTPIPSSEWETIGNRGRLFMLLSTWQSTVLNSS